MRGEGGELEGHLRKGHKSAVFLMKSALWGGGTGRRVIPSELERPAASCARVSGSLSLALSLNLSEPELVPVHGDGDGEPYSSLSHLPPLP